MHRLALTISIALTALAATVASAEPVAFAFKKSTPISAPDGRWDFTSWDAAHQRLLVSHGQDVLVIDPAGPSTVHSIGKVAGAHAALAIPGSNNVLVSSGQDDSVRILDETTGTQLASIAVASDPDAAIVSEDGRTAYVMGAKAGAISIIDLNRRVETGRIALKPALEVAVLVNPTLIAVNNEDQSEIELADLATGKAAGAISLPGCKGPTGLAYAPQEGLALSVCANRKAALVDIVARRVVKLLPIGLGPDTAIWQADKHRFLVPCGRSGTLSVITLNGRRAQVLPAMTTELSARTAALDPTSGQLYLPAASFHATPSGQRPSTVPGSFHIVVLAPAR